MDGAIALHGLLGIMILFGTMIVLAVMILIVTGVYLFRRSTKPKGSRVKNQWLFPPIILLIFDAFLFLTMAVGPEKVWRKEEAAAFDERMLYCWIPAHIVGYVLLAVIFYFVSKRKAEINEFIDRLR